MDIQLCRPISTKTTLHCALQRRCLIIGHLIRLNALDSGMTVYELRDMGGTICIQSNCDELHSTRIVPDRPTCMSLLFACGCAFSKEKWLVLEQDTTRAIIAPVSSFFEENSIKK
ncbi:hypothetical protein ANCDUO_23405 [Ancylostoma duodenale]|uniref:Uncharacterized protein n=1 Tax=Ancylostoma duodenale TaxID=51022 RepID=A0A0C2C9P8_9BILA|nr:hypothetical protein ANCDUO_23405 [Ancylostoma duodenale]